MARAKSRPPRQRNAAATREAILQSARRAFAKAGYDGAGVREIASGAGVTAMRQMLELPALAKADPKALVKVLAPLFDLLLAGERGK